PVGLMVCIKGLDVRGDEVTAGHVGDGGVLVEDAGGVVVDIVVLDHGVPHLVQLDAGAVRALSPHAVDHGVVHPGRLDQLEPHAIVVVNRRDVAPHDLVIGAFQADGPRRGVDAVEV